MGVDLRRKHVRKAARKAPKSSNVYLALLVKLYRFLARRTGSVFNKTVVKRLYLSNTNKAPVSVGKIARYFANRKEGEIAVVCGTVTDDKRFLEVPKLTVCALKFTESARSRIVKAGGQVLTFDQLALQRPKGTKCVLIRGAKNNREAVKHFGKPGVPNSHAKPYNISEGRKFGRATAGKR